MSTDTTKLDVLNLADLSPVLADKVRRLLEEQRVQEVETTKWDPDARPRFVFSRTTPSRDAGASVRVRNGLDDEPRGGTILRPVGRAWVVDIRGIELLVHDPEDSWE